MKHVARVWTCLAVAAAAVGLFVDAASAQNAATTPDAPAAPVRKLVVGVKQAPPFAMKAKDGEWSGISVELWRNVAEELELPYDLREVTLPEMIDGLKDGSIDVGVGALTVTAEREEMFDFSHPFYSSGLGIAASTRGDNEWIGVLKRVFSAKFLTVVAGLAMLLLVVGGVMWLFERNANPDHFGAGRGKGIGAGFWWAAVTMTTVGYGDKAPVTLPGRLVGLVWMFASIILISIFTAGITTALTVSSLGSSIAGPEDLPHVRVGSVDATTSATYLQDHGIGYTAYDTVADAMDALADGKIDAVLYDEPILRWLVQQKGQGTLEVLPNTVERQDYGLGLQQDSPLRERVNRAVLQHLATSTWDATLQRYLGKQ
ncbi:MAG: transporter substrate-binding domain-containing protein [Phycisphaera sp.]|nr:transporter substrate-binding domain-containing protein [Phycisphaera sp.]